ncbi:MAG: hypothetical protein Q3Y08_01495 [Butyricicoccus sp.]|nr:hypothetical protein [Butyricicoccus sp.]
MFLILCLVGFPFAGAVDTDISQTRDGYTTEIEWLSDVDFIIRGYLDGVLLHEAVGKVGGETVLSREFDADGNLIREEIIQVSDVISPAPEEVVQELRIYEASEGLRAALGTYLTYTVAQTPYGPLLFPSTGLLQCVNGNHLCSLWRAQQGGA